MKKIIYKDIKVSKKLKSQTNLSTNQIKSLIYQNLKEIQRKKEIAKKEKLQNKYESPFIKNKKGEYVLKKKYTPDDKFINMRIQERYLKIQGSKNKVFSSFSVKSDFKKGSKLFYKLINTVYKVNKLDQQEMIQIYEKMEQNNPYFINYIFGNHDKKKYKDYTEAISSGKEMIKINKQIIENTMLEVLSQEKLNSIIR